MRDISSRLVGLSPEEKRALLAQLLQKKANASKLLYPLSQNQQALWFLYQLAPQSAAYNLMCTVHIHSELDIAMLQRAMDKLIDRHSILRTTYTTSNGMPAQQIHNQWRVHIEGKDASAWSEELLNERLFEEADYPFDLERGPLIRLMVFTRSAQEHILLLSVHHIVADFWSLDVLSYELHELFMAELMGTPALLLSPDRQYTDYVRWQAEILKGPEGENLWAYWKNQLAGELPVLNLPTDRPRPTTQTYSGALYDFELVNQPLSKLKDLARACQSTLYMTLLAAFQVLLHRYTGQEDILVGSPLVGRSRAELEGIIGNCVNPVIMRADLSGDPTFQTFLERVRCTVLAAIEHQDYPFPVLVERLQPVRDLSRSPLFQVMFIWNKPRRQEGQSVVSWKTNAIAGEAAVRGMELEPFSSQQRGAAFDLTLTVFEVGESLSVRLQYNTDLFDATTIARMARHFQTLIAGIIAHPEKRLSELLLMTETERQLCVAWNDTAAEFASDACLHELFEAQVERTPDATAAVMENDVLTYRELNHRANQLAHYLRALGVGPELLVGICMDRSLDMIVGLLGILKAGGAYVPLDPAYPQDRQAFILENSQARVLLTQQYLRENFPEYTGNIVCLDVDWPIIAHESIENITNGAKENNLAYVIYTSGSTGRPKGVQILHRAVVNFLHAMRQLLRVTDRDVLLAVTSLSFDIAALELFLPMSIGAHVIMVSREVTSDGVRLLKKLTQSSITLMQATPSTWQLLLEAGWQGSRQLRILCGGEALTRKLANQLLARGACLWNLYGPTETTIWSTAYKVEFGDSLVPIGRPIANTQVYILDSHRQPVPVGVAGELHIGGVGLARGYLYLPELTAEKFISHTFNNGLSTRLYKTGDMARYQPDGNIEFLDRLDNQVKIRGYRIELGEIEAVLRQHSGVHESVVLAREDIPGRKRLVAYIIPVQTSVAIGQQSHYLISELRRLLKKKLPDFMQPSSFVFLQALPLTPNGKVDRKALLASNQSGLELEASFVAPCNRVERLLARIWSQVLDIEKVSIHDNFFDLGGASIQVLQVIDKAREEGLEFAPEKLFAHQTIAELAAVAQTFLTTQADLSAEAELTTQADLNTQTDLSTQVKKSTTIIESLGIYLPPETVSTNEVVQGCKMPLAFPLERLTGIRSRHVAGEVEFSIDLAKHAIANCLARSSYKPEDIDLLICCNISRYDGPHFRFSFEPNTSVKLRRHFGFNNALAFDISNACAGMFTAIKLVDAFIKVGVIRRGMVVSGEYITHLTQTAQKEIESFMDSRLACLTLGDAGAALILEKAPSDQVGFHAIDLYSLCQYNSYCIAKTTDQEHGGAIMYTDSLRSTAVAIKESVTHAANILKQGRWVPEDFQHLIMHQTSATALSDAVREINSFFNEDVCSRTNVIYNLSERGNTASTSHFVALMDNILNNKICAGDRVIFSITASGMTIGTGLYTFDDLPERLREEELNNQKPQNRRNEQVNSPILPPRAARVRLESVGVVPEGRKIGKDTIELAKAAAEDCFEKSLNSRSEIDLLIHAGVYRNDFLCEPAIATMVAEKLGFHHVTETGVSKQLFAFDTFNGSLSFLNACCIAIQLMGAQQCKKAMIVASEIENNSELLPAQLRGIHETGSALILAPSGNQTGFSNFIFKYYTDYIDAFEAYTGTVGDKGQACLYLKQDPAIEDYYLKCIPDAVRELLSIEELDIAQIKVIFPPQISSGFITRLSDTMKVSRVKFVDVASYGKDLFTSSLPYAWQYASRQELIGPGDIGLIINVGTGIQVGCAIYYF